MPGFKIISGTHTLRVSGVRTFTHRTHSDRRPVVLYFLSSFVYWVFFASFFAVFLERGVDMVRATRVT